MMKGVVYMDEVERVIDGDVVQGSDRLQGSTVFLPFFFSFFLSSSWFCNYYHVCVASGRATRDSHHFLTFKVKQHVQLVVSEHLRDELDVHVCYVDVLQASVQHGYCLVEFLDVCYDACEQLRLLVFVRAFLIVGLGLLDWHIASWQWRWICDGVDSWEE